MDKVVMISEPFSSNSFSSESKLICRVCEKQFSQYTCPRCNVRYCSLNCYKRHSLRCTESFMRDNVMTEMQNIEPDDESKKKMLDIIKRFHSGESNDEMMNSDDDDDSILSDDLVQKVLSGKEVQLEDLSPSEIKQFKRAIATGELSKMIEPWTPWWKQPSARNISLSAEGTHLVIPMEDEQKPSVDEIPSASPAPIPPLSQISSANPSPLLPIHLIDMIYSYCFTVRLYNGDWRSDPLGAATEMLNISSVLCNDKRPESIEDALSACLEKTCSPLYKHAGGFKFGAGLIDDVASVLSLGGNAIICLLCDVRTIVSDGEKMGRREKGKGEVARRLRSADRKVYFMLCWVHEQTEDVWPSLGGMLEVADKPFARTRDDPDLDKMLKERVRFGDPMAHLIKSKNTETLLEDLGDDEKMKESGFIVPQTIPSHSWIKRGIDYPPNRYNIRPGRHWDGVDRSNGYEKEMFKRQSEKQATESEAYMWSVADM